MFSKSFLPGKLWWWDNRVGDTAQWVPTNPFLHSLLLREREQRARESEQRARDEEGDGGNDQGLLRFSVSVRCDFPQKKSNFLLWNMIF